uniref:Uncharacterized protein n=1 Tax=Proboscia inermis TaxID=420281 RepID=A0A7S0CKZ1_9STRA
MGAPPQSTRYWNGGVTEGGADHNEWVPYVPLSQGTKLWFLNHLKKMPKGRIWFMEPPKHTIRGEPQMGGILLCSPLQPTTKTSNPREELLKYPSCTAAG